ncbi:MAG: hypothetical protein IPM98_20250 [Lewinellaceae bacterium]|nr:hypothetical protein [Lewinellaceae bacterium]
MSVSCQAGTVDVNGCNREQEFTFTAIGCGITSTCIRTFTWTEDGTKPDFTFCPPGQNLGLNPPSFPAPGAAIASDNCGGNPGITSVLGNPVNTGGCNWSRTRTYTATDACGNTQTCIQVFTYTLGGGVPVFTYCPPGADLGCNPASIPAPGANGIDTAAARQRLRLRLAPS